MNKQEKPILNESLEKLKNHIRLLKKYDGDSRSFLNTIDYTNENIKELETQISEMQKDIDWLIKIIEQSQKDNKVIDSATTYDSVFVRKYYKESESK